MSRDVREPAAGNGSAPDAVAAVRAAIDTHRPGDGREAHSLRRVAAALATLARPLDRLAGPEHVTGSAVVVGSRGTVLHLHKRLHRWLQPGGHLEPGEAPWEAAWREAQEETGLSLEHPDGGPRLIHVDVHGAANGHTHLDLRYLLLCPDRDPAPPPGESPEARWFGWDEALARADGALVGALRAARRQPESHRPRVPGEGSGPPADRRVGTGPSSRHNGAG